MASKTKKRARKRSHVPPSSPRRSNATHARPVAAPTPRAKVRAPRPPAAPERRLYAYAVGAAALAGVILIGLSLISAHRSTSPSRPTGTTGVVGVAETAALLKGIPQHGNTLGSPNAPVRLVEYADPQCPFCAQYAVGVLPTLIRDYVRPGSVQLVFRGLWFLDFDRNGNRVTQDSATALATATAAGLENRFWNVLDLLYRNQGPEQSGWVTDSLLRSIVTGAGADAERVIAARSSKEVSSTIKTWSTLAQNAGVNGVPASFYGRRGGALSRLNLTAIAVPEFRAALDGALKG